MKLLLHCCCAPCAVACIESLAAENETTESGLAASGTVASEMPTLFWYNPNIHPLAEYQNRRDVFTAFAAAKNLEWVMFGEYGEQKFLNGIGGETERPKRCELCYRMRLTRAAVYAAEKNFDAFSTSLLISPYQQHDTIRRIGEELAAHYGIAFLYRDFRPLFRQGQNQARSLGLYMQKYCGCMYSKEERYAGKTKTGNDP